MTWTRCPHTNTHTATPGPAETVHNTGWCTTWTQPGPERKPDKINDMWHTTNKAEQ